MKGFLHKNLTVWQKSYSLAKDIYFITRNFPKSELYGLTSQMRRAASSIPLNIAEGKGRASKKEFLNFLNIARGSLYELSTCLDLVKDLEMINMDDYKALSNATGETLAQLNGLTKHLKEQI